MSNLVYMLEFHFEFTSDSLNRVDVSFPAVKLTYTTSTQQTFPKCAMDRLFVGKEILQS